MVWRRKKSLVNPRQQVWFALELVTVAFGFNILCAYLLFIPPTSEWFGGSEVTGATLEGLGMLILLKWPLVMMGFAILFIVGIIMSHRFAGPVFGLLKALNAWKSGDRGARVHFRKYDYLLPVMPPLNAVLSQEAKRWDKVKEILEGLAKSADAQTCEKADEGLKALQDSGKGGQ